MPLGHLFVTRPLRRPRWRLVLAAMATAIPIVVLPASPASAVPNLKPNFNIATFADLGLDMLGGHNLTNFVYLPSGKILAIGKTGFIAVGSPPPSTPGAWTQLTVNGTTGPLPVESFLSDRGLTGLDLAPDFPTSRRVYLAYNYSAPNCSTAPGPNGNFCGRVSSFILNDVANPTNIGSESIILDGLPSFSANNPGNGDGSHTVGTVIAAPDKTLFVGNGDASSYFLLDQSSFNAQNLDSPRGKIFHVNPDGSGVSTNRFYDPATPSSWQSRVFAYGLRNPFRFSLKPGTNSTLYIGDVGASDREEIDVAGGGENFGWPCYEGELSSRFSSTDWNPQCPQKGGPKYENLTAPIWSYAHFGGNGNAVIGGVISTGSNYGSYNGSYFFGDNVAKRLWTLKTAPVSPPSSSSDYFGNDIGQPTIFRNAPNGNVAYGDLFANKIYEIRFGCPDGNCPPVVQASVTPIAGPPGTGFNFDASQSYDPEGAPLTYTWNFGDSTPTGSGAAPPVHPSSGLERRNWTATVTVSDGAKSDTANVAWSTLHAPPSISITPNKGVGYAVGDGVTLTANATGYNNLDQGYPIGGTDIRWQVFIHHCPPGAGGCHLHPSTPSPQPFGSQFSTVVPDHGDDIYVEFKATATDADRLSTTVSFNLPMSRHSILVGSNVPGVPVTVNTFALTTPATATAITNSLNQLIAPASAGGQPFVGWSDGSTNPTKQFTMPASDVAYAACYGGPCSAVNSTPPGLFSPVTPYRLFDTRDPAKSPTGTDAQVTPGQVLAVDVSGQPGPPSRTAVLLNVTTDKPAAAGYVRAFPCGSEPETSTVNFDPGQVAANLAMVKLPADGHVCFTSFVPTHLIVDVAGWFSPASQGAGYGYSTVDPVRVLDTRQSAPLVAGQETRFSLAGRSGFPADATAALLNLTATEAQGPGYVRVYPCGEEQDVSNVNYVPGQNVANLAAVKVASGGDVCFKSYATTQLVVDLAGWYAPGGTGAFSASDPTRLFDTRSSSGFTTLGAGHEMAVQIAGGLVPAGATSVALNVTAADPDAAGYVKVYPCGGDPFVSNVNYRKHQVAAANLAVVKLPADGRICFSSFATTDLIVDLAGWYMG